MMNFRLDYTEFEKKKAKAADKATRKTVTVKKEEGGIISIQGKRVVVTGALPGRTRRQVQYAVERAGGTFQTTVANNTHYVITGNTRGTVTTKMRSATRLGIPIIQYTNVAELRR